MRLRLAGGIRVQATESLACGESLLWLMTIIKTFWMSRFRKLRVRMSGGKKSAS